jgi:pSer/pThr/pTyr-binding forkhead associated (FHA) protein
MEMCLEIALAKDPQQRIKTVRAFANTLEQACRDEATYLVSEPKQSQHLAEKKEQTMEITLQGPFGRKVLGPAPLTIGKAQDNQLVIADTKVSGHHAEIRSTGQGYTITDLGSTNGTFVNGELLARGIPRMLNQGDSIRLGDTTFTYLISFTQQSETVLTGGTTERADYAYQQADNPYQAYQNPYTGYGLGQEQQTAPAAPPPPSMQSPYTPVPQSVPTPPYVPPPYAPAPQPAPIPKPMNLQRVLIIAVVILVLVGGGVGTGIYLLTRPHPVISVTSKYNVGSTPAGATSTTFLDGTPVPGNTTVQSDANGNVNADLTVTDGWAVGNHTLTARDASNYTTPTGFAITIVPSGEANTPGPNSAPPDAMSFKLGITIQHHDVVNNQMFNPIQETLIITGRPDPAGGTVCQSGDDGQPHTYDGTLNNGSISYHETYVETCSGTYKGGKLSYTQTVTSDQFSISDGSTCTVSSPYTYEQLQGSFTTATTISGTYSLGAVKAPCNNGNTVTFDAESGTWSGQVQ